MEDCKPVITPMQTSCKLRKDDDSKSIDQRQYRSMIGILLYVTTSRLDVMQAVGKVAQFQEAPKCNTPTTGHKKIFFFLTLFRFPFLQLQVLPSCGLFPGPFEGFEQQVLALHASPFLHMTSSCDHTPIKRRFATSHVGYLHVSQP
jgi:hypothetical protein